MTYHHGALRSALVDYALQQIRQSGWEGFSMREAAREIGVSPGAAYRHFKTLEELLLEIAEQGFAMLDAKMQEMRNLAPDTHAELIGVGMTYIQFSKDETNLFNLMFSDKIAKLFETKNQTECSSMDCDPLVGAISNYLGQDTVENMRGYCDFFWSLAHGISALEATTGWQRSDAEKRAILEMGITTLNVHEKKIR